MHGRDAQPNYPYDQDTTPYCSWWWDNDGSIPCEEMPDSWGFTMDDFVRWNPTLSAGCSAYKTSTSYCVEAVNEPPVSTTITRPTATTILFRTSATTTKSSTTTSTTISGVKTTTSPTTTSRLSTTTSTKPANGIPTPTPTQSGMVDNCDAFYQVKSGDNCAAIATKHGISVTQFLTWNTAVGGQACTGLWVDAYVCVSTIGHTPSPTTSQGNGIPTPTPTQPGMVDNCNAFYQVKSGDSCAVIAAKHGISVTQFLAWNTAVGGQACTGLWVDAHVCVSITGHTPPPTTSQGNGIATPTPVQPGMVHNCDAFYKVVSGDSCASIASKPGISVAQLAGWNGVGGTACPGLWLGAHVCVSIVGHNPSPTTTTRPGNGIATPTPTQTGMTPNCKAFHLVAQGQTRADIAARYRVTTAQFVKWNPAAGSDCSGLWANTYACVAVL